MTVEKVKRGKNGSKSVSKKPELKNDFESLDNLMKKIDTFETEEQVPELFEEDQADLLTKSFKSLLSLMNLPDQHDSSDDFDTEKLDESVMEIMSQFLDEGLVDEEEFEDFFTEELAEEEDSEESDDSESEIEEEDLESEEELISSGKAKTAGKKPNESDKKKSKHMKELEMLMEKVEDESDLDDDEYESEDEDQEDDDIDLDVSDEEEFGKKDIFAEDTNEGGRLSSFEKAQAALKYEISTLEAENLNAERPWALRGEINARQRPSDSLLEEAVDFDNLSRPTPQITEERTEEIEDIIKRRISEAAWDDVERKDGRDLTLLNGMPANTQKAARALLEDVATAGPHRSLTQVYEDEAATKLSGTSAVDQETLEKQTELTALFAKICRHVDGLSGNRFAPKIYVQSDFQIKTLGGSVKK